MCLPDPSAAFAQWLDDALRLTLHFCSLLTGGQVGLQFVCARTGRVVTVGYPYRGAAGAGGGPAD